MDYISIFVLKMGALFQVVQQINENKNIQLI